MRKIMRRILSYLCAVCMLFSSVGDLGSYIYAAKTLPVILTKTLAASDGETYEIAASFEVRVPEDWDEERDGDYLDSLNVELAVRELNAPEEPEPEEEPGSPENADPAEEADPADDTEPADEAEPVEEPEAAEEEEPEEEPEYEYSYEEYVEKAAAALECESGDLACVRVFDISLRNRITGEELQPESSVKVSIRLLSHDAESGESLNVVHFGDEPEVLESSMNEEAVEFETESFSVFVVLGTVLEKELTASDGKEYRITVSYDRASGIPADAVLCVTEIKEGDEGYGAYVAAAAEALGRSAEELVLARPFDITLMDPSTGEAFQPNRNVAVSIQLLQDELGRYSDVNVLHFPGEEGALLRLVQAEGQRPVAREAEAGQIAEPARLLLVQRAGRDRFIRAAGEGGGQRAVVALQLQADVACPVPQGPAGFPPPHLVVQGDVAEIPRLPGLAAEKARAFRSDCAVSRAVGIQQVQPQGFQRRHRLRRARANPIVRQRRHPGLLAVHKAGRQPGGNALDQLHGRPSLRL